MAILDGWYPFTAEVDDADGFFPDRAISRVADNFDITDIAGCIDNESDVHRLRETLSVIGIMEIFRQEAKPCGRAAGKVGFDLDLRKGDVFSRILSPTVKDGEEKEGSKKGFHIE